MKALSIGRDQSCDIVIVDRTDVVSRRHAILNISSTGKYTIVDQSRNGTYVNGIRISPNVPVPVSRKDVISFGHVAKLDWHQVDSPNTVMKYILLGVMSVLILIGGIFGGVHLYKSHQHPKFNEVVVAKDSTQLKKENKQRKDSIDSTFKRQKEKVDSLKQKQEQRKRNQIKKDKIKKEEQEKKNKAAKARKDSVINRPIG